ncbi:hypothetical protein FA13DRAFT_1747274 [Coprinellus micaceus]|uniref:Nephrocystin 3-like N-terminal domain-containing protein n=1 Tax=Coprinellus micaceus TaxID=71717 RepID=A0A4Y7S4N3_COPMI|nr:hypothetical protein FA13DRAFT_1747274 [Coprinellus micaceus]
MDASSLPNTHSLVAKRADIRKVTGDYHDNSVTNIKNIQISSLGRREMDALLNHVVHGALHDSAERGPDAPKCHPDTRTAVQRDMMSWIRHDPLALGPAGSGKTAIAGTIADECEKEGLLAATFFFSAFSVSIDRRLSKNAVSTLLYSLLQHKSIVGLKEEVLAAIDGDPVIFERHLDQQLEKLILRPLRKVAGLSDRRHWPKVIIVDGLDECEGCSESDVGDPESRTKAQKEILSVLSRACADLAFPFRFIVASRPEPVIQHFFSASPDLVLNIFLDDKYDPDADIRLFLEAMLSDIRRRFSLSSTWVSKAVIDTLVKESSGQFIYAATVIRFLDNPRLGPPQEQLNRVLEWQRLDNSAPFAPPKPFLAVKWLLFVKEHNMFADEPLYIKELLESYPGETEYVLRSLTSLVGIVDESGGPRFDFYHKSLLDFLKDPKRNADLYVDKDAIDLFIKNRYYEIIQGRGPLSDAAATLAQPPSKEFLNRLCNWLPGFIDPSRKYSSADVEWWLANLGEGRDAEVSWMFASIHEKCDWYHCLSACDVWRNRLLRHGRERGWRLPTAKEMLQDRVKKFKPSAMHGWSKHPLRPPSPPASEP